WIDRVRVREPYRWCRRAFSGRRNGTVRLVHHVRCERAIPDRSRRWPVVRAGICVGGAKPLRPRSPCLHSNQPFVSPLRLHELLGHRTVRERVDHEAVLRVRSMNTPGKGSLRAAVTLSVLIATISGHSHAARIPPQRLVEVVDISTPSISPDGRLVAFRAEQASVDRNTYDSAWYVQPMERRTQPRRVGEGGVPLRDSAGGSIPTTAAWSPDGKYIFYRALVDGRVDVWRAAADGSGAAPVTFDPADVREFSLSADGRTLKDSVGATRDEQ